MLPLPIDPLLPDVVRSLAEQPSLVLEAPPGAGKTTRVPRALLDHAGLPGDVVVLEPRRLAARMAAERVAEELGEAVGGVVGYQVRFEEKASARTRVRFVTEGMLTRRLLSDPRLQGTSAVVLDEFHERHVHGDVALALLRRLQRGPRPDLRIVVMSATLEAEPVARYLDCPSLRSEGRAYEVAIEHVTPDDRRIELQVVSALRKLVQEGLDGDVLVFLPGAAEIRACLEASASLAEQASLVCLPLHGELSPDEQRRAVRKADRRKVIFSTNVAESSVTIDGVVAVIDTGLHRQASFAPWSGMPVLKVTKVSKASAIQRAGRAGRTRPGRAIRLYTKGDFDTRPDHDPPELRRVDLAQLRLELASLGASDVEWLDAPTPEAWRAAGELLGRLGATDGACALTDVGRRMLRFPAHPRAARLMVDAEDRGVSARAATVCAILGERDIRQSERVRMGARGGGKSDLATEASDLVMLESLFDEADASGFSHGALRAIGLDPAPTLSARRAADRLRSLSRDRAPAPDPKKSDELLLRAVLAGFPDRVARRKAPGSRELALAGGGLAQLDESSVVRDAELMCAIVAETREGGATRGVRVRIASGIEPEWLIDAFEERIEERTAATWNDAKGRVETASQLVYDGLVLSETRVRAPSGPEAARVLFERAKARGARAFAPEGELDRWIARMHHAHDQDPAIPAPTPEDVDQALLEACEGRASLEELGAAGLLDALRARSGVRADVLERLAPERVRLASGRETRVLYELGKPPWIESFLQDFCGMRETPRAGRVPIVAHMLAPNRRAVQITTDVPGFFERHYAAIRKELMRKYPRHPWPEDTSAPVPAKPPRRR